MTELFSLEPLERREHLSVSRDHGGWTVVTPSDDTQIIFVSSSAGDDRNDGRTSKTPVKTLARGYNLLRQYKPDWLLLKTDDVFEERLPTWRHSGRSKDEPMLIGSYGPGEKPIIHAGSGTAFRTGSNTIEHLAIIGVHFFAHTRDPYNPQTFTGTDGAEGLAFWGDVHDLLIEDVVVDQFEKNITFTPANGRASDVTIRRSVITDAYNGSGVYANGVDGITIEGNVFDHNGWNEMIDIPDQRIDHNLYFAYNNTNVVVEGNVFADGGMHGLQARSGGIIRNNLFVRNAIGMTFGIASGANSAVGGAFGEVSGNIFLGGRDVRGAVLGWAIELGNTRPGGGTIVRDNIIAHDMMHQFPAIQLSVGRDIHNPEAVVGLNDVRIVGNVVYNWHSAIGTTSRFEPGSVGIPAYSGVLVKNNDFQRTTSPFVVSHRKPVNLDLEKWEGNRYFSADDDAEFRNGNAEMDWDEWHKWVEPRSAFGEVEYFAPGRSVETYNASLGGKAKVGAFMTQARLQSRRFSRDEYSTAAVMQYLREGFTEVKGPPRLVATNLSHKNLDPARERISFWFSRDVSESIDVGDLAVWSRAGDRSLKPHEMGMTYDPLTHVATWTFPGMRRDMLWAGDWAVWLHGQRITADGEQLDVDGDGQGGDPYFLKFTLKPRV